MARFLRIWEKKRGARRTGSHLWGSVGEALFFGTMFLTGIVLSLVLIATQSSADDGFWVKVMVLASFILLGGGGLVYTFLDYGISRERRSALRKKAEDLDLIAEALPTTRDYPNVPSDNNLTNSPGIRLAYRLPSSQSPAWRLLAASVFFCVWVVILGILAYVALQQALADGATNGADAVPHAQQTQWLLNISLIPFVAVAFWSGRYLWRQIRIHMGIGPTNIEVSDHPLVPGNTYQVFLSQAGRLEVQSLEVILMCEEQATYRHGTDVRTEAHPVYRQQLIRREGFSIDSGIPFEEEFQLPIPAQAMHSFQGSHNAIHWKLVVSGEFERWPQFERSYPLVVLPTPVVAAAKATEGTHGTDH